MMNRTYVNIELPSDDLPIDTASERRRVIVYTEAQIRRAARHAKTRQKIFDSAMELMKTLPYEDVTVAMIAKEAGIGKGSFFSHFHSKQSVFCHHYDLQLLSLEKVYSELMAGAIPVELGGPGFNKTAKGHGIWSKLTATAQLVAKRDGVSKALTRNVLSLALVDYDVRMTAQEVRQQIILMIAELLRMGQEAGEVRPDVKCEEAAEFLYGVYDGALFCWVQSDVDDQPLSEVVDNAFMLAARALTE